MLRVMTVGFEQAVMAHVERLIEAGLAAEAIGVITPYNGQVAALRELRTHQLAGVEISSVDGFQGARQGQYAECKSSVPKCETSKCMRSWMKVSGHTNMSLQQTCERERNSIVKAKFWLQASLTLLLQMSCETFAHNVMLRRQIGT